jgi:exodeoxyribonuclease V beta subunit
MQSILEKMQENGNAVSAASVESTAQILKSFEVWRRFPHSTSYSQIAHGTQEQETDEGRLQKDEVDNTPTKQDNAPQSVADNYPRGAELGNAIHKIFELVDFEEVGKLTLAEAQEYLPLLTLVQNSFTEENLDIEHHPGWVTRTIEMVWHTLNGHLEVVEGPQKKNEVFNLKEVSFANRRS